MTTLSHGKLAEYQRALEAKLQEIDVAMAGMEGTADTVILDQSSVGRLSRMDAMQQQAMAAEMRARLESQILGLKAALDRITAGSYGMCCQCDVEMDVARLSGDPAAVFCAECSAERELHKGRNRAS